MSGLSSQEECSLHIKGLELALQALESEVNVERFALLMDNITAFAVILEFSSKAGSLKTARLTGFIAILNHLLLLHGDLF